MKAGDWFYFEMFFNVYLDWYQRGGEVAALEHAAVTVSLLHVHKPVALQVS